jgi:flagellar motor switch protein FliN/FliY
VLEEIAEQLLPRLAAEALAPVLIDESDEHRADHGSVEIELHAAPEKCRPIEAVLQTVDGPHPVTSCRNRRSPKGQVSIRFADQRRDIDLSDAAERMSDILRAFAADAGKRGVSADRPAPRHRERCSMMTDGPDTGFARGPAALQGLPIEIRVCVGHARPTLGDMLAMQPDGILPLDSRVDDMVQLLSGERLIATGELVELDGDQAGRLAVRIVGLAGRIDDTA